MPLTSTVRIRFLLDDDIALGPGKVALLAAIRDAGSISAAAKTIGMSYRRAWLLVETMNACFAQPLVEAAKGGVGGGGARITDAGVHLLSEFQRLQQDVESLVSSREPLFCQQLRKRRSGTPKKS